MNGTALEAGAFARLIERLGPFEPAPVLAVGVSGGPDSMALTLLAQDWALAHGGRVVALTVDHGLRAPSAGEARQVGAWLAAHGIEHRILVWGGPKPAAGIQAAAREARRALLLGWCRSHGVLHLLLGHQREDVAETVAMRAERGSGPDGLAAMAAIVEMPFARILRPLLGVARASLCAFLEARGQAWIADPSNENPAFARTRIRRGLAAEGTVAQLGAEAAAHGAQRREREQHLGAVLARVVAIHPQGWARLDRAALAGTTREVRGSAVARVLGAIGGSPYAPRRERLDRLLDWLEGAPGGRGRTLGGCRILAQSGAYLVVREPATCQDLPVPACDGVAELAWDGRFRITLAGRAEAGRYNIAALGARGWAQVAARMPAARRTALPPPVLPGLPALTDLDGVVQVPHLLYTRTDADARLLSVRAVVFRPARPLAPAPFAA